MNPLISVIVPVYKVEKYLRRCIDSILAQTYENIEVLLIDDGSPDQSGAICDDYQAKDSRVRVFHKENGGVSSARNLGLKETKGDYIGFVDADDYIDEKMYETLLTNILSENADTSICSYFQEANNGVFHKHWQNDEYLVFDRIEQILNLVSNRYYTCSCWDRLFKKSLLDSVIFNTEYSFYEDYLFLYEVMQKSEKAVFTSVPLYYYCNNQNSAARAPFNTRKMDIEKVCKYVLNDIQQKYPEVYTIAKREYGRILIFCCSLIAKAEGEYPDEVRHLQKSIRKMMPWYLFSSASMGYKSQAMLISMNWNLYKRVIVH